MEDIPNFNKQFSFLKYSPPHHPHHNNIKISDLTVFKTD